MFECVYYILLRRAELKVLIEFQFIPEHVEGSTFRITDQVSAAICYTPFEVSLL